MFDGIQVNTVGCVLSDHKKLGEIWINILNILCSVRVKEYVVYKYFQGEESSFFSYMCN